MTATNEQRMWEDFGADKSTIEFATKLRINPEKLLHLDNQAIALPYNVLRPEEQGNSFPPLTKEVLAALRRGGLTADLYRDEKQTRTLVRHSADIVLPVLVTGGGAIASILLNVVASWIYDRLKDGHSDSGTIVQFEYAILDKDKQVIARWRKIEAPACQLPSVLRSEAATIGGDGEPIEPMEAQPPRENPAPGGAFAEEAKGAMREGLFLTWQAENSITSQDVTKAEELYREALVKMRYAVLFDRNNTEFLEVLHRTGRAVHDHFGCILLPSEGAYKKTCPVLLAQFKYGFSIGGSSTMICSICGKDSLECPHERGQTYNGVIATKISKRCNICLKEVCEHVVGTRYDGVQMVGIVTDINLDHIALVERPADPRCTVNELPLSEADVLKSLTPLERKHFVFGLTPLYCHHCRQFEE